MPSFHLLAPLLIKEVPFLSGTHTCSHPNDLSIIPKEIAVWPSKPSTVEAHQKIEPV